MTKGTLIAVGITIGMLLPPIVHFISGPIGPFVGGYIGVAAWNKRPQSAIATGLIFGIVMWVIFAVVVALVLIVLGLTTDAISGGTGVLIVGLTVGATFYIWFFGTVGATVGASRSRRSATVP